MKLHYNNDDARELYPLIKEHHYLHSIPANVRFCFTVRLPGGLLGNFGKIIAGVFFCIPPTRWSEAVLEKSRLVIHPSFQDPQNTVAIELMKYSFERLRNQPDPDWNLLVSHTSILQHRDVYKAVGWNYHGRLPRSMDGVVIGGVFNPGRRSNSLYETRSPKKLRDKLQGISVEPHYDEGKHVFWKALSDLGETKARRLGLQNLSYPKADTDQPITEAQPASTVSYSDMLKITKARKRTKKKSNSKTSLLGERKPNESPRSPR